MAGERPQARLTDFHVCPMVTGLVPHVGGPIIPPCCVTVLVNMLPAARITDLLTCVGPPDVIIEGSPTVLIGNLPASRILDTTVHGGKIVMGSFNVWTGTGAAGGTVTISPAAARAVLGQRAFPGQQNFNNCGVQSTAQLIFLATGQQVNENAMLAFAVATGHASPGSSTSAPGGTNPDGSDYPAMLAAFGVPATTMTTSRANLEKAVKEGKPAIVTVNPGILWGNPAFLNGGHAVTVTGGTFDNAGNLQTVTVNDTGNGTRQEMPVNNVLGAANLFPPGSVMTVTDNPVLPP